MARCSGAFAAMTLWTGITAPCPPRVLVSNDNMAVALTSICRKPQIDSVRLSQNIGPIAMNMILDIPRSLLQTLTEIAVGHGMAAVGRDVRIDWTKILAMSISDERT